MGRVWSKVDMLRIWPWEGGSDPRLSEVGIGWVAYGPKWTGYGPVWDGYSPGWAAIARS